MGKGKLAPVSPGEILLEEFIKPHGMSQNALARAVGVPPIRINEIVLGKRAISADTALRLGKYFGTTAQFWMNLQTGYELEQAKDKAGDSLRKLVPLKKAG